MRMLQGSAGSAGLPGEERRQGSATHQEDHFMTQVITTAFNVVCGNLPYHQLRSCQLHGCACFLAVQFHHCRASVLHSPGLFKPKCCRTENAVAAFLLPTTGHLHMTRKCLKQQSCSAREAPCPVVQQGMLACLHCHYAASTHDMIAAATAYYSSSCVHAGRHGSPGDQLCSLCLGIRQTCCQQCLQRYKANLCKSLLSAQWKRGFPCLLSCSKYMLHMLSSMRQVQAWTALFLERFSNLSKCIPPRLATKIYERKA